MTDQLPEIVLTVGRQPGPHRRRLDLRGSQGAAAAIPTVDRGARVGLMVGPGLEGEDIAKLAAWAQQVRGAAVVEIRGYTRRAVEAAREALLLAWQLDVDATTPKASDTASAARWAALMLATVRKADGGR